MPLSRRQAENMQVFERECMAEYLRSVDETKRKEITHRTTIIEGLSVWNIYLLIM